METEPGVDPAVGGWGADAAGTAPGAAPPGGDPAAAPVPTARPGTDGDPGTVLVDTVADGPPDIDAIEALLDEVDGALARLDDGTYRRCQSCGTLIADDRLDELPTARTCAACAAWPAG